MKIWFFFLLVGLSGRVFSQQKFIEVRVSDTVLARAEIFVYRVMMNPNEWISELAARQDADYSNYGKRIEEFRRIQKRFFDSVVSSLRRQYELLPPKPADTFRIARGTLEFYTARFLFHSVDTLSQFYNRLKEVQNISGAVEVAMAKDENPFRNALYKKLLDEAGNRAGKVAAYNHERLGAIISVTEEKVTEPSGGWTSYVPLSALSDASEGTGWHTTIALDFQSVGQVRPIDDSYAIKGALIVRFSVE